MANPAMRQVTASVYLPCWPIRRHSKRSFEWVARLACIFHRAVARAASSCSRPSLLTAELPGLTPPRRITRALSRTSFLGVGSECGLTDRPLPVEQPRQIISTSISDSPGCRSNPCPGLERDSPCIRPCSPPWWLFGSCPHRTTTNPNRHPKACYRRVCPCRHL